MLAAVAMVVAQGNVSNETASEQVVRGSSDACEPVPRAYMYALVSYMPPQGPSSPEFRTWELVVIAVDGAAILFLFAIAGLVCTAVVDWRRRQRIRLCRVGHSTDDTLCAEHGRVGVSGPTLYKDIVITELIGRGTFTLVHTAHLGYQEMVIKTLKGRCNS